MLSGKAIFKINQKIDSCFYFFRFQNPERIFKQFTHFKLGYVRIGKIRFGWIGLAFGFVLDRLG